MNDTKIEWCDTTLNPVVGCKNNCSYCYARKLNYRFNFIKEWSSPHFFPKRLRQLESKKPKRIFMNSMSDIEYWDPAWVEKVSETIVANPQHEYIFLTNFQTSLSNIKLMIKLLPPTVLKNVYFGLTITGNPNNDGKRKMFNFAFELTYCVDFDADVNLFLSYEPILFPLTTSETFLAASLYHWIILGSETGNRRNKVIPDKEWVDPIIAATELSKTPLFIKDSLVNLVGKKNMKRELPINSIKRFDSHEN